MPGPSRRIFLVFFTTILCLGVNRTKADEYTGFKAEAIAHHAWQKWEQNRRQLRSCRFELQGTRQFLVREGSDIKLGERYSLELIQLADWSQERFLVRILNWGPQINARWLETQDMRVQWIDGSRLGSGDAGAWVKRPDPRKERLHWQTLIDPRVIGFAGAADIGGSGLSLEDAVTRVKELPTPEKVIEIDPGRFQLEYVQAYDSRPQMQLRQVYVINANRGFTIETVLKANVKGGEDLTVVDATFEWKQIDDVWVPTKLEYMGRQELQNLDLQFRDWQLINEPLPEEMFSIERLELPDEITVYDELKASPFQEFLVESGMLTPVNK